MKRLVERIKSSLRGALPSFSLMPILTANPVNGFLLSSKRASADWSNIPEGIATAFDIEAAPWMSWNFVSGTAGAAAISTGAETITTGAGGISTATGVGAIGVPEISD